MMELLISLGVLLYVFADEVLRVLMIGLALYGIGYIIKKKHLNKNEMIESKED